jgi:hypothetical protein
MTLAHDLTVLPGVPIDRTVRCPGMGTESVSYAFDVEWEDSDQHEIVFVALLEPVPFQCEEWVWQPPREAGRTVLLDQKSIRTLTPAEYDAIADLLERPSFRNTDWELLSAELSPCRYWQLSSLAFLRRAHGSELQPLQLLGIAEFGPDLADRTPDHIDPAARWQYPLLTPQFETNGEARWTFRLPDELRSELHELLTLRSASGEAAVEEAGLRLIN